VAGRDDGLILRGREIARFQDIMARNATTFVLVAGKTSSGKSTLMHYVRRNAEEKEWRTIPSSEQRDISLISTSSPTSLANDIAKLLGEPVLTPESIIEPLVSRQPVMLVLEAHALNQQFAEWLTGDFVAGLKKADAHAVITVVADLAVDIRTLRKAADEIIKLGAFDAAHVRNELASYKARLTPPLSDDELDAYAKRTNADPMVLVSLVRLLRAATR
jgi:hypothetical protein